MHCGYLTREGKFIDCSLIQGPIKHESMCRSMGMSEEYLMEFVGWVKLTLCLPNEYLFMSPRGLSQKQIDWLSKNGYEIEEMDLIET